MIKFIIGLMLLTANVYAGESCTETESLGVAKQEVSYYTAIPKGLEGATVCVHLKDDSQWCASSEQFAVVPRLQKRKVDVVNKTISCNVSKKNTVYADFQKGYKNLSVTSSGPSATVELEKGIVPSINYYRHEVLDTPIGLGVGVDSDGTVKGAVGIDF